MDPEGFEPSPNTLMAYRATVTPRAHAKSISQRGAFAMARCENLSCRVSIRERRLLKMQTTPEISEAVASDNNSLPAKVTLLLSKESGCRSSYFKKSRTLPYEPSTAPERNPPSKRNGTGGTRTLTVTSARNCAAITPQAHEPKLTSVVTRIQASVVHSLKECFVLERASAR